MGLLKGSRKGLRQKCLACGKPIRGQPRTMRLKITSGETRLIDRAKELGFTSSTWKQGDFLQGNFDRKCFGLARFMWKVAFNTRLVSPRR